MRGGDQQLITVDKSINRTLQHPTRIKDITLRLAARSCSVYLSYMFSNRSSPSTRQRQVSPLSDLTPQPVKGIASPDRTWGLPSQRDAETAVSAPAPLAFAERREGTVSFHVPQRGEGHFGYGPSGLEATETRHRDMWWVSVLRWRCGVKVLDLEHLTREYSFRAVSQKDACGPPPSQVTSNLFVSMLPTSKLHCFVGIV